MSRTDKFKNHSTHNPERVDKEEKDDRYPNVSISDKQRETNKARYDREFQKDIEKIDWMNDE